MKRKNFIFILIGILSICFIGATVFFVSRGMSAANKQWEYFDVYRDKAEEYIKSDTEMLNKYGSNLSVKFDNSVTYSESRERDFFDKYIEVFAPRVPDSLEEFTDGIDMIKFNVTISGEEYEITFEKNSLGELVVTRLSEIKQ